MKARLVIAVAAFAAAAAMAKAGVAEEVPQACRTYASACTGGTQLCATVTIGNTTWYCYQGVGQP